MSYTADPRQEELQLLRQLARQSISTRQSATYDVAKRLEDKGEAMGWWDAETQYHAEITATGKAAARRLALASGPFGPIIPREHVRNALAHAVLEWPLEMRVRHLIYEAAAHIGRMEAELKDRPENELAKEQAE